MNQPTNQQASKPPDQPITVTVRFFAGMRETLGASETEVEVPAGTTVAGLIDLLQERHPVLRPHTRFLSTAVNRVYVGAETELHDGDEVACLPPVGGG